MEVQCPLCDKKVSYPGFSKHLFSATHSSQLEDVILKVNCASDLRLKSRMPLFRKDGLDCYLCLGCKRGWMRPQPNHLDTCPNAKAHHALLSCWLGEGKGTEEVSSDQWAEMNALRKELIKAKEEAVAAKEEVERVKEEAKSSDASLQKDLEEAYNKQEELEEEIEKLKEGTDNEELEAEVRMLRALVGRLVGLEVTEEIYAANETLRKAKFNIDNPVTTLQDILRPTTSSAPPQPPPLPFQLPQPQQQPQPQQDNPFAGKLLQSTKRPGKVLARC